MKKVLFWGDFTKAFTSKRLIDALTENEDEYCFEVLSDPELLAKKDLSEYYSVILMITDVTKLSVKEKEREYINIKLDDYVSSGGRLIATHDALYRRCRNQTLQEMYGYKIFNFQRRESGVTYRKTMIARKMKDFDILPDMFILDDEEICWGDPQTNDLQVYFEANFVDGRTNEILKKPVCFGRKYGDGSLFWFNTGDTYEDAPGSVKNLDQNLLMLILCLLKIDVNEIPERREETQELLAKLPQVRADEPYLFISYCSENDYRVYLNLYILYKMGINFWLDRKNITSAEPNTEGWKNEAMNALENCSCALLTVDESFMDSKPCEEEIARINKSNLVPIVIRCGLGCQDIIDKINSWGVIGEEERIESYRRLLCIDSDNRIDQITFEVQPNFSHLLDEQFLNTLIRKGLLKHSVAEARDIIIRMREELVSF